MTRWNAWWKLEHVPEFLMDPFVPEWKLIASVGRRYALVLVRRAEDNAPREAA